MWLKLLLFSIVLKCQWLTLKHDKSHKSTRSHSRVRSVTHRILGTTSWKFVVQSKVYIHTSKVTCVAVISSLGTLAGCSFLAFSSSGCWCLSAFLFSLLQSHFPVLLTYLCVSNVTGILCIISLWMQTCPHSPPTDSDFKSCSLGLKTSCYKAPTSALEVLLLLPSLLLQISPHGFLRLHYSFSLLIFPITHCIKHVHMHYMQGSNVTTLVFVW